MLKGKALEICKMEGANCFFLQEVHLVKDFRSKDGEAILILEINWFLNTHSLLMSCTLNTLLWRMLLELPGNAGKRFLNS